MFFYCSAWATLGKRPIPSYILVDFLVACVVLAILASGLRIVFATELDFFFLVLIFYVGFKNQSREQ